MWRTVRLLVIAITVALAGCAEWALEQLQPDASPAPEEVLAAARAGDARAAFLAYRQATTNAERRNWICIAANRDLPQAQAEIARLLWRPPGLLNSPFERDKYKAYIWSIIAIHRRQPLEHMEERLGWVIPDGERWRAMLLAVSWRPDPSKCENMEDSEYFSIAPVAGADPAPEEVLAAARPGTPGRRFLPTGRRLQTRNAESGYALRRTGTFPRRKLKSRGSTCGLPGIRPAPSRTTNTRPTSVRSLWSIGASPSKTWKDDSAG